MAFGGDGLFERGFGEAHRGEGGAHAAVVGAGELFRGGGCDRAHLDGDRVVHEHVEARQRVEAARERLFVAHVEGADGDGVGIVAFVAQLCAQCVEARGLAAVQR